MIPGRTKKIPILARVCTFRSVLFAMAAAGITGRSGAEFGASPAFVRLELLMREETFGLLAEKLRVMLHP